MDADGACCAGWNGDERVVAASERLHVRLMSRARIADKLNANPTVFASTVRGHDDDDFDDSKTDEIDALEVFGAWERRRKALLARHASAALLTPLGCAAIVHTSLQSSSAT